MDTPVKEVVDNQHQHQQQVNMSGKRRRLFQAEADGEKGEDQMPAKYAHIRDSERSVKDAFYLTVGELVGTGMSMGEACRGVVIVGNGLFGRNWKEHSQDTEVIDIDTLPDRRNIRDKLNLLEVETLALAGARVSGAKELGSMITHSIDSTTKRRVGTFATQGIGIGRDTPVPLPLINIAGESVEDIARQVQFIFELLAAVQGKTVEEVYGEVDLHMTDSTGHNKGVYISIDTFHNHNILN